MTVSSTGLFADSPRNWPPLGIDDNDGYLNQCIACKENFVGHKHHVCCRVCHDAAEAKWKAMTLKERDAYWKKVAAEIAEFYSANAQGEGQREKAASYAN